MKKLMFLVFVVMLVMMSAGVQAQTVDVQITPDPAYDNDDLTCNIAGASDPSNWFFRWRRGGDQTDTLAGTGENVLARSYTSAGETWYCNTYLPGGGGSQSGSDSIYITEAQNNPPGTPSYLSPANGEQDVTRDSVVLSWNSVTDPDGDPVTYDVYFGSTPTPTLYSSDEQTTSYGLPVLSYETTYYWKIVAKDDSGDESHGPVWSFTTEGEGSNQQDYPSASLTVSNPNPEPGEVITFDGSQSTDPDGMVTMYEFNFGDGGTAGPTSQSSVQHAYTSSGYFNAQLRVRDDDGQWSSWVTVLVDVREVSNEAPVLSGGSVNPSSGDTSTTYTYSVTYLDSDNDAPSEALVYIDGGAYPMTNQGTAYSSGVQFTYSGTFSSNGDHNYYFSFSDGQGNSVRLPSSGSFTGPTVGVPKMNTNLGDHDFGTVNQGNSPASYSFFVKNEDSGSLDWYASASPSWLRVSPSSGTSTGEPDYITVSVPDTSLMEGRYTGTVTVTTFDGGETHSGTMDINVVIPDEDEPVLVADPNHDFGEVSPGAVKQWTFSIRNSGTGTLDWSISDDSSWVTVLPSTGSTAEGSVSYVTVTADTSSLTGHSSGIISITSNGGDTQGMVSIDIAEAPNEAPRMDSMLLEPFSPLSNQSVRCDASVSDQDGDLHRVIFKWLVNDVSVRTVTRYVSGSNANEHDDLGEAYIEDGDTVKCEARVYDDEGDYDFDYVSTTVGRAGANGTGLPQVVSVGLTPASPRSTDTLTCTAHVSDQDGGLDYVIFEWYINGVHRKTNQRGVVNTADFATDTLDPSYISNGDNIRCQVTVYDVDSNHDSDYDTISVGSGTNAPPISVAVEITPRHPNTQQDLTCRFEGSDMDDNLDYVIFEWYVNGLRSRSSTKEVSGGSDTAEDILNSGYTYDGDDVRCKVTVYDTGNLQDSSYSGTVTVEDEYDSGRPRARLDVDDRYPQIREEIRFDGDDSYDNDGYVEEYYFHFDDGDVSGWITESRVYHEYDDEGTYYAKLRVRDDDGRVSDWSPTVTIRVGDDDYDEEEPRITDMEITPSRPDTDDDLKCTVDLEDDDGDLRKVEFRWFLDGSLKRTVTKYTSGYYSSVTHELSSYYTDDGDNVRCEATVYDHDGNRDTESESVRIGGVPSGCRIEITKFSYPSSVYRRETAWIDITVKNTGTVSGDAEINIWTDGSFEKRVSFYLSWGASKTRKIYFPLPSGDHNIRAEAFLECGESVNKYGHITVYPLPEPPGPTPPGPTPPAQRMKAEILQTFLDIPWQTGKSFSILIDSPESRVFDINIEGVPDNWVDYPENVTVDGRKIVYAYVVPRDLGRYSMNVSVSSGSLEYSKMLELYVVPEGEQDAFGRGLSGMFVLTPASAVMLTAFALVVIFLVVLHYGFRHMREPGIEEVYGR